MAENAYPSDVAVASYDGGGAVECLVTFVAKDFPRMDPRVHLGSCTGRWATLLLARTPSTDALGQRYYS